MQWTPEILAEHAEGQLERASTRPIATAFIDSRQPRRGALFVPIIAARDGHGFIDDAIAGGASAVLIAGDRPLPAGDVTVVRVADTTSALTRLATRRCAAFTGPKIVISGSNGKTTTRAMVAAVLGAGDRQVLCTRGNLNNHLGVPLTVLDHPHAPDAMVIELGMNAPGENRHLAGIVQPNIAILTSIALEHLEFMQTIEAIAAAECEPFEFIPPDGLIVIPADEARIRPYVPSNRGVRTFGSSRDADVRILEASVGVRTHARLALPGHRDPIDLQLALFGAHHARNAAAALAVGAHLGVDPRAMVTALEAVEPVGDRGRLIPWRGHWLIADCYNANPGSMRVALESLATLRPQRSGLLVAVLGDMLELGARSCELHEEVGNLAAQLGIDHVIGYGPDTRATVDAATRGGISAEHCDAWETARDRVLATLEGQPPSTVLFKGSRGLRLERILDAITGAASSA